MSQNFADQLLNKVEEKESRLLLGLRPNLAQLPKWLKDEKKQEFGRNWAAISETIISFERYVIEAVAPHVVGIMPRLSCYQMYGAYGLRALERTIVAALELDLIVVMDAKFADFAPDTQLAGQAYIGAVPTWNDEHAPSNLHVHAMTIVPYYGPTMLNAYVDMAVQNRRGLVVVVNSATTPSDLMQASRPLLGENNLSSLGILLEDGTSNYIDLLDNNCFKLYRTNDGTSSIEGFADSIKSSGATLNQCFYVVEDAIVDKYDRTPLVKGENEDTNIQAKFKPCLEAAEAIKERINEL